MSIRGAGNKYGIPEATIRHKISGYHGFGKKGPPSLLSEAEESVLVNYIENAVKRAHPVTKMNVLQAVKTILED